MKAVLDIWSVTGTGLKSGSCGLSGWGSSGSVVVFLRVDVFPVNGPNYIKKSSAMIVFPLTRHAGPVPRTGLFRFL